MKLRSAIQFRPKFFETLRNYDRELFSRDVMAGIIVGIVAIPLAIAFGIASGVGPTEGLVTAIIAGLLISVFGGSKVQIGGPTGAFIVIIYGIIQQYGLGGLAVATVMAGVILILMGLFRFGTIIKFMPYPIIVGFTGGIAITIFSTQMNDLFGLGIEQVPANFIDKWICYFRHLDRIDWWAFAVGAASILIIRYTPRLSKKIPGSLAAIVLMTLVCWLLKHVAGVDSIRTIGDLLDCFPFRYIDRTRIWPIADITESEAPTYVQLRARVTGVAYAGTGRKQRFTVTVQDATGRTELVWFRGIKWIEKRIEVGREYLVFGRPTFYRGELQLAHPEVETMEQALSRKAEGGMQGI